ncbi:cytochrome P450 [Hygrophoropsis aurantiaca]|uniref:Cytochrome P450 n=1 Tax=Hygrophoropsis aurantiaca TaxID=72124 RepID=A0ACB7ZRI1_9AGAM|nr:cytochrome P450 [Hygrophoropsis aurantiaca]
MVEYPLILTFMLSAISIFYARRLVEQRRVNPSGLPYPPGPRGLPVLGNLFDINMSKPWLTYTAWRKKYGDIVHLTLLVEDYIVISSVRVAGTLLGQRSSNYSDRLTPTFFGVDFLTVFLGYTKQWKVHRKLFNITLRSDIIIKHRDLYMRKAHELALKLINDSEGPPTNLEEYFISDNISRFSGSVIMAVTYGYEVTSRDGPLVARARKLTNIIMDDAPVERAVLLTAFPLHGQVSFCRELAAEVRDIPFNFVKEQRAAGTASHSMVFDFFENYSEGGIDEEMEHIMRDIAASAFLDVQERAQSEIDALVGKARLPGFEHQTALPYVGAILRETLRWNPGVVLGIPHATTERDTYNVMSRAAANDPDDAACFNPNRYSTPDGKLCPEDAFTNSPSFGFGRRICAGRFFAEGSIWAAVVTMLATLSFTKAQDLNGTEIDVNPEFTGVMVSHPKPFKCRVIRRSTNREKELRMETGSD